MQLTPMRKCRARDYHPYIDNYMDQVRNSARPEDIVGKDILLAMDYVEDRLNDPDVFIDDKKIDKAVELMERYFEIKLFDWELFVTACIHCFYVSEDTVVFSTIFIMMARGNGKNGFISPIVWYLTTHYHGITGYNIDIVANAEDQAQTSFDDIFEVLERTWIKSKKFFYKSKVLIVNLRTKSYIKFNTSNAKTKDSKRTGCLVFDEVHQYEDYAQIKVYTSGFGKRKHSRAFYITTDGDVREGVLDDLKAIAGDVLKRIIKDLRWLPLLYRIDEEEEALDPKMWYKANPSLKYLPTLRLEMEQHFTEMKYIPAKEQEFYTKRMNWPRQNRDLIVTEWDNILATNKPLPDLTGRLGVVGIDYMKVTDFASAGILIREGDTRYWISHSWLCTHSADIPRLKIPWQQWADEGYLTVVDDVEVSPDIIAAWVAETGANYGLQHLALDNYRYALLAKPLKGVGFDARDYKNVSLIRPSDIMKVVPIIDSCFAKQNFVFGDNPLMRWAVNNTKLVRSGKSLGQDTGNYVYGKIEAKSRKTDPFMALVAAMTIEEKLGSGLSETPDVSAYSY